LKIVTNVEDFLVGIARSVARTLAEKNFDRRFLIGAYLHGSNTLARELRLQPTQHLSRVLSQANFVVSFHGVKFFNHSDRNYQP
jgi:hypothetical protein